MPSYSFKAKMNFVRKHIISLKNGKISRNSVLFLEMPRIKVGNVYLKTLVENKMRIKITFQLARKRMRPAFTYISYTLADVI